MILLVAFGFALGYYAGRHSLGLPGTLKAGGSKLSGPQLGPWQARFSVPGSVEMPDNSPIIRCDVPKQGADFEFLGYLNVTITNLTTSRYGIRYNIYGYDSKGRRVSEGGDEFRIGSHESVVRQVFIETQVPRTGIRKEFGRTFWVQMMLEE